MQFAFVEAGWTRGRVLRVMLIVAVAYYLGARLGLALTMHPQPVSTLWPPNAILLAALLLTPPRIWPFVLLGALPAHLFVELTGDPFFTSKRHGLGLGLSICRTIVTAHGGALWGVNNPDRGATFHLVLRARHHAA